MDDRSSDLLPRMPTWPFIVLAFVAAGVVWLMANRLIPWGIIAFGLLLGLVPPFIGKRYRPTAWAERLDTRFTRIEPRLWAVTGWVSVVIGVILCVVTPLVVIDWLRKGDLGVAALNLFFSLPVAIGFVLAGLWLIRNRKRPFS
jgi:hypothetical protein